MGEGCEMWCGVIVMCRRKRIDVGVKCGVGFQF